MENGAGLLEKPWEMFTAKASSSYKAPGEGSLLTSVPEALTPLLAGQGREGDFGGRPSSSACGTVTARYVNENLAVTPQSLRRAGFHF